RRDQHCAHTIRVGLIKERWLRHVEQQHVTCAQPSDEFRVWAVTQAAVLLLIGSPPPFLFSRDSDDHHRAQHTRLRLYSDDANTTTAQDTTRQFGQSPCYVSHS